MARCALSAVPHPRERAGVAAPSVSLRGVWRGTVRGAAQGGAGGRCWAHPSPRGRQRGRASTRKRSRRRPPDFPGRQGSKEAGGRHAAVLGKAPRGAGGAAISRRGGAERGGRGPLLGEGRKAAVCRPRPHPRPAGGSWGARRAASLPLPEELAAASPLSPPLGAPARWRDSPSPGLEAA